MRKPEEYNKAIREQFKKALLDRYGTMMGKKKELQISDVKFDPFPENDDYERHKQILANKKSEGINVFGHVKLMQDGKGSQERWQTKII